MQILDGAPSMMRKKPHSRQSKSLCKNQYACRFPSHVYKNPFFLSYWKLAEFESVQLGLGESYNKMLYLSHSFPIYCHLSWLFGYIFQLLFPHSQHSLAQVPHFHFATFLQTPFTSLMSSPSHFPTTNISSSRKVSPSLPPPFAVVQFHYSKPFS